MVEAVIFDFDGVLVDTPTFYFKHMKEKLQTMHAGITDSDIAMLVGQTFSKTVAYLNKKYSLDLDSKMFSAEMSAKVRDEMSNGLKLDPDLKKLLISLREKNVPLAVCSSNNRYNIDFFLKLLGITHFFDVIVSYHDVEKRKPFPDSYMKAVSLLGKTAQNCIAFEDTIIGVQAAKKAGLKCVAFPNKFLAHKEFSEADLIIKNFSRVDYNLLKGLIE